MVGAMWISPSRQWSAAAICALALHACSQHKEPAASAPAPATGGAPALPSAPPLPTLDAAMIGERLGAAPLALPAGALGFTLPRSGVPISIEGKPLAGALSTQLTFRPAAAGAALSGSVELLEDEVSPTIDTLLAHGIQIVGLYNRFLYDEPRVLVLRFEGQGNPALLASGAQSISSVLRDARLRSQKPVRELPGDAPVPGALDSAALGGVFGVTASVKDGVVSIDVPRPPAAAPSPGAAPQPAAPWLHASFSGSDLRAELNGSLLIAAQQLGPVLNALRSANVHLVGLVPLGAQGEAERSSLYFRGKGNSLALARGLSQALQAGSAEK
jgi:hypothetical protein